MFPVLFKLGSFELYSYGLMMALGVLLGLKIVDKEALRYGWDRDQMMRLVVLDFAMGLLGSRILYVFTRMNEPGVDIWAVTFNLRAGFVYYGGLISAWLFLVWYLYKHRKTLPCWPVCDAFAMGICGGLAIGRFGCLLGGCCFGTPTTLPWGVVMVREAQLGHLHPVQLYEAFSLLLLLAGLWWRRLHKAYEGELVVLFVGIYAVLRYVLEFWRGDSIRGYLIEDILSTSQFISVPMIVVAVALHLRLRKKAPTR